MSQTLGKGESTDKIRKLLAVERFECSAWLFAVKSRRRKDVGNKITNMGFFCDVSQALWGCSLVKKPRGLWPQVLGSTSWLFLIVIII